jgi:hypothetical protein
MTENYSGFYPEKEEEEIRYDILFDLLAAVLQESQPFPVPFRVYLPVEYIDEFDEQEIAQLKVCTSDAERGLNQYLSDFKLMIHNPETECEFRVKSAGLFLKNGKLFAYGSQFEEEKEGGT